DAIDVDGHREGFEPLDLRRIEPARRDDAHMPIAGVVERATKKKDEPGRDPAQIVLARGTVCGPDLLEHGPVDERLARVDAYAPEPLAERGREPERGGDELATGIDRRTRAHGA